jgi:hypothetical protein
MGSIDTYPPQNVSAQTPLLAYSQVTTNQAGITTEVDVTGLSVTITIPAGRRIKITGSILLNSTVANDTGRMDIKEGSTTLQMGQATLTGVTLPINREVVITPSAGTHTYKITAQRSSGTGSLTVSGDPTFPDFISVEDITGSQLPVLPQSVPVGQLGYAQVTASQGSITTQTDLIGLSVNVVVPSGRILKISAQTLMNSTVADDVLGVEIMEGATRLAALRDNPSVANQNIEVSGSAIVSPSAGAHTYKLQALRFAGTGTVTMVAAADAPAYILVEDITPTPAIASGAPSSTLGYGQISSGPTISTTVTDLPGATTTVTVASGRRLKITGRMAIGAPSVANNEIVLWLYEDGVAKQIDVKRIINVNDSMSFHVEWESTPSAGSHTYKLAAQVTTGAGNFVVSTSSDRTGFIIVEDITGVSLPYGSYPNGSVPLLAVAPDAWTSYTPSLTASTPPTLGAGNIVNGKYMKIGRLVTGWASIKFGTSGVAGGSGSYRITLPVPAANFTGPQQTCGSGYIFDVSAADGSTIVSFLDTGVGLTDVSLLTNDATGLVVTQAAPWTWAASDELRINFTYEAAS